MTDRATERACAADEKVLVTALEAHAATSGAYTDEDALVAAGLLRSTSTSHDVVLAGDSYSIVATGDCASGSVEVASEPSTTTTTAPPTPTNSISAIEAVNKVNVSTNKWRATATVRVTDDLGATVSAATVAFAVQKQALNGSWSDLGAVAGATDGSGAVAVSSVEVNKYPTPKIRFRVTSVTAEGLTWLPDATWVEVAKP